MPWFLLRNVSLNEFNNFLKRSGLYNKNYPLRGDNRKGTFYVWWATRLC